MWGSREGVGCDMRGSQEGGVSDMGSQGGAGMAPWGLAFPLV